MIYLILILAFILRLPLLGGSLWLDEAAQFLESARPLTAQLQIRDDFQPPLMHLLTFVGIRLGAPFGLERTEWWLRLLPSLIPGLVTIWALYQIGLQISNRKTALLSSLFLATSSLHIFYSQELRPYSLPAMFGTLATWQLLGMLKGKNKRAIFFFGLCSILGLYSSYLYPFLLIGQFAYLLWQKFAPKKLLLLGTIIIASFLPWLPKFLEQLSAGQALRASMPGWEQVVSLPQFKTALLVPLKFIFGVSDLSASLGYLFLTLVVAGPLLFFAYLSIKKLQNNNAFFICLLILPLLLSWLVSFVVPVLQAKRVLFLLPIFSLLEAWLIIAFSQSHRQLAKIALTSVLIINLFSTLAYWTQPKLQRENWRALHNEIVDKFPKSQTALLFSFDQPFAPWSFYDQTDYKTFSTGVYYTRQLENPAEALKDLSNYRFVLVFDYLRDLTDPDDLLLKTVQDLGFHPAGVLDYPGIGFVRIYSKDRLAQK